jgi:hypothetical protein
MPKHSADPIIGTWKLNATGSKFSPIVQAIRKQAPPKERSEVYREIEGDQIELTGEAVRTDGSSSSYRFIWPRQGGTAKVLEGGLEGVAYTEIFIAPGDWYVAVLRDGKQAAVMHKTVSGDGRTLHYTIKGADQEGNPFEQLEVFDRQ